jgi:hypothetical protein
MYMSQSGSETQAYQVTDDQEQDRYTPSYTRTQQREYVPSYARIQQREHVPSHYNTSASASPRTEAQKSKKQRKRTGPPKRFSPTHDDAGKPHPKGNIGDAHYRRGEMGTMYSWGKPSQPDQHDWDYSVGAYKEDDFLVGDDEIEYDWDAMTLGELRTMCNDRGLSCRDHDNIYLTRAALIRLLST